MRLPSATSSRRSSMTSLYTKGRGLPGPSRNGFVVALRLAEPRERLVLLRPLLEVRDDRAEVHLDRERLARERGVREVRVRGLNTVGLEDLLPGPAQEPVVEEHRRRGVLEAVRDADALRPLDHRGEERRP